VKIIDTHAHIFIPEAYDAVPSEYLNDVPKIIKNEKDRGVIKIGEKIKGVVPSSLYFIDDRLLQMEEENIDMQLLSIYPYLFFYQLKGVEGALFSRMFNDALSELVKNYNKNFLGLGTVPLQDVDKSIEEMERVKKIGLAGVEIGSNVNGSFLGEAKFMPFFEAAEKLGVLLFVHPSNPVGFEKMKDSGLDLYVGNICDTSATIASMIFNGIFDRFPKLKIYFAHGGGFVPYQIGRLMNAYLTNEDIRRQMQNPPPFYFTRFLVDTVVYDFNALNFLLKQVPIENILLGSDSPVYMSDKGIVSKIKKLKISQEKKEMILEKNIEKLLYR